MKSATPIFDLEATLNNKVAEKARNFSPRKSQKEIQERIELERLKEKIPGDQVHAKLKQKSKVGIPIMENKRKNSDSHGDQIASRSMSGPAKRYVFMINPNTKPRQTRSDKWKKRKYVVQYRAFADRLRNDAKDLMYELRDTLNVEFTVPMPASWSENLKKQMDGMPHRHTPDVDNFVKAVFDALAKQDKGIWKVSASKRWGRVGKIEILET